MSYILRRVVHALCISLVLISNLAIAKPNKQRKKPLPITQSPTEILKCSIEKVSSWSFGKDRELVTQFVQQQNLKKGVEIGVALGYQSEDLLRNGNVIELYSIDPYQVWKPHPQQTDLDVMYHIARARLQVFGSKSILMRKTSTEAVHVFADAYFDFVYIDGNHSEDGVWLDLNNWYPKIRKGGFIILDDYSHPMHPGVAIAVNRFAEIKNLDIKHLSQYKVYLEERA